MPFDAFDKAYGVNVWRGIPVTRFITTIDTLRDALPEFELRPFGIPPNHHPAMRSIVRLPTPTDGRERPVAAVSDSYDLIQHRVIATWLYDNLAKEGLGKANATIDITEYGERLRVTVPLSHLEIAMISAREVGDTYAPELVLTNSVDRSCALSVALRWRRLICRNGMFVPEDDRMRSVHHVSWSRTDAIRAFMSERIAAPPRVATELTKWSTLSVMCFGVQF